MEWINPTYFWGLLGVLVPILIHLWNGRNGKVIPWAATAWLNEEESQSQRSIQIQEWLLLFLRILLWVILVLIIVGVWLKSMESESDKSIVHLVQPDSKLVSEYRFEIAQAQDLGEEVFWLAEGLPEYDMDRIPEFKSELIQAYLDELSGRYDSVFLYFNPNQNQPIDKNYWVEGAPEIVISQFETQRLSQKGIQFGPDSVLTVGNDGNLSLVEKTDGIRFVGESPILFSLSPSLGNKKESLQNALKAIDEVYQLKFVESDSVQSTLAFSQFSQSNSSPKQLKIIPEGDFELSSSQNRILTDPAFLPWNEIVAKGILPELILNNLLEYYQINSDIRYSKEQLQAKFVEASRPQILKEPNSIEVLLVLLLMVFIGERYLAFQKNL